MNNAPGICRDWRRIITDNYTPWTSICKVLPEVQDKNGDESQAVLDSVHPNARVN